MGITQKLLHQIKYRGMPELAEQMGYLLGCEIQEQNRCTSIDMVLPVPLHPRKKKLRGYNQSDYLARGIARALNTNWSDRGIERIRDNETQTDKNRQERIDNVTGIFRIRNRDKLRNQHILIVDDVVTTGATLESCAVTVQEATGCKISLASLAISK
jgi:ComF family protein